MTPVIPRLDGRREDGELLRRLGQGAALPLRAELHRVLGEHNVKEEQVVHPATDRALQPEERDALVARIQGS